jgi:hypothetical protein
LEEELTCDLIAALAFVNFEAGTDCFRELTPPSMPLSVRQLGDIFYLAIKTGRYLQILTAIGQFGANVTAGMDDLHRGIIEMTARTNVLTDLLLNVFQVQLGSSEFREKPDFGKPLTHDQVKAIIHGSLAHLMKQHHERLLGPFETLTGFFVAADEFERDNSDLLAGFPGAIPDTLRSCR